MGGVAAAFSPDGKWLLTEFIGHNDEDVYVPPDWKKVTLWEVVSGKTVRTFPEDYRGGSLIVFLAFLPDSSHAISAGPDRWRVFEVPGGKVVREVKVENYHFFPLDLSRDGKRLLSYGADGRGRGLSLWDVQSGKVMRNYFTAYPIIGGRFSPDSKKALINSIPVEGELKTLRLWDFEFGQEALALEGGAAFRPDSGGFVAIQGRWLVLWDIKSGRMVRKIDDVWSERWLDVVFTQDGKNLLAAADRYLKRIDLDGDKLVWTVELQKKSSPFPWDQSPVHTVVFSPDRTIALVADGAQHYPNHRMNLALWDAVQGKLLRKLVVPRSY
jgi:WD40 repeat protein